MTDPERLREALERLDDYYAGRLGGDTGNFYKDSQTALDAGRQYLRILEADEVVEEVAEVIADTFGFPVFTCEPMARAVLARLGEQK